MNKKLITLILCSLCFDSYAADLCKARVLRTMNSSKTNPYAMKKGEIIGVTQYNIDKYTGLVQICGHGSGCYQGSIIIHKKHIPTIKILNCKVTSLYTEDEQFKYYGVEVDRSKNSKRDLRLDDIDNRLLDLGLCSACAGNYASEYVNHPNSRKSKLVKSALEGNPNAIDHLNNDSINW